MSNIIYGFIILWLSALTVAISYLYHYFKANKEGGIHQSPEHINCRSVSDPRTKEFASFYNEHPIQYFITKKSIKFRKGDIITISYEDHFRRYSIHTIGKIANKNKYYVEEI